MKLLINISEEDYNNIVPFLNGRTIKGGFNLFKVLEIIKNGKPLPKGHGDLIDKTEILRFLKCPKYENCDWKNCFDCNESRCINLNNVNDLVPIIEADKAESEVNNGNI